jgi:uncharacterized protein YecE (DUF72 family)
MNTTPRLEKLLFRDLHPKVRLGTASDRYAGWIGQIYTEERYANRIAKRSKTVAGKTFQEEVLPVDSVEEYFQHFAVLELDFTFYSFLLDQDSKPTQSYWVLREYRDHLGKADRLILKVPQAICAQRLPKRGGLVENTDYLNSKAFIVQFYEPAKQVLGDAMSALIFEEAYLPKQGRPSPGEHAEAWDRFFQQIPKDNRYHLEVRTETLPTDEYFKVLEEHGVGQVFSHWTWLPSLSKQFGLTDQRFFNAGQECIIRLITPRRVRYEESYRMAYPFNQLVDGMLDARMIEEGVEIASAAIDKGVTANVIINNRAGGNAPIIAQRLAQQLAESLSSR